MSLIDPFSELYNQPGTSKICSITPKFSSSKIHADTSCVISPLLSGMLMWNSACVSMPNLRIQSKDDIKAIASKGKALNTAFTPSLAPSWTMFARNLVLDQYDALASKLSSITVQRSEEHTYELQSLMR